MYCKKCENEIKDTGKYCSKCGELIQRSGRIITPEYKDIGQPIKKQKVSAYKVLPRTIKMLSFKELFSVDTKDKMILGSDGIYYWLGGIIMYAMTEDCIMTRVLSPEEIQMVEMTIPKETFKESLAGLIYSEIDIASGTSTYYDNEPAKSDNTVYKYYEYQHIKKVKPSKDKNYIHFTGMYGGNVSVPKEYYDFVYAYVSARI